MIFVDTSALFAVLDRDDRVHDAARETWSALLSADAPSRLLTRNYTRRTWVLGFSGA